MEPVLVIAIVAGVAVFVWRFVTKTMTPGPVAGGGLDDDDPLAGVREPRNPCPPDKASAVALEEPDDDDE